MKEWNSRSIDSTQVYPHEGLIDIIEKYKSTTFRKPITRSAHRSFEQIMKFVNGRPFILDLCCGVGLSTYLLAKNNKTKLIIGVDKSGDRVEKNNYFKKDQNVSNYLIIREDLVDLLRLLSIAYKTNECIVEKIYLLYPNPYPKKSQVKKRWHASPVCECLFAFKIQFIVRSNWEVYLDEFKIVAKYFGHETSQVKNFNPIEYMTHFEKKYHLSEQKLYELILN